MPAAAIQQKIVQLMELLSNPENDEGSILRVYYELFQLSNEGRDLSLETLKWLNETASLFLSAQLVNVLTKLHLHVYGFKFAALNFIDIDDVIYDLSHGEILRSVHSLPPGAFNKLKRLLLEPPPPPRPQHQPQSLSTMRKTPYQQLSRRNYFAAPSSTSSSASNSKNDSDESEEGVDPYSNFVRKSGRPKRSGTFSRMKKDSSAAGPVIPLVSPPLFAPTGNRPQGCGHSPTYEPPFQPTQNPHFGTSSTASGMVPVLPPLREPNVVSGSSAPLDSQIDLKDQTGPSSLSDLTAPFKQISTQNLLVDIPEPHYLSVSTPTEAGAVLFDQHCKLYRCDDGILKEHGVGQLKLLHDQSTKKVRLLMRRDEVLEMCADQFITTDLKLLRVANQNWCIWSAVDYADSEKGELKQFAVRFETEEQFVAFRKAFEGTQSALEKATQPYFGNTFAPKSGSSSCDSCSVNNKTEATNCFSLAPSVTSTASTNTGILFSLLPLREPTPSFTTEFSGTGTAAFASDPKPAKDSERKQVNGNAPSVTIKLHPTSSVDPASEGFIGSDGSNLTMNNGAAAANLNESKEGDGIPDDDIAKNASTPVAATEGDSSFANVSFTPASFSVPVKEANSSFGNTPVARLASTVPVFSFGSPASFTAFGFNMKSTCFGKQNFHQPTATQDSRRTIKAKRSKTSSPDPPATESTSSSKIVVEDGKETVMFDNDCTLYRLEKASNESNWVLLGSSNVKIVFNEKMRSYRVIAQDGNHQCMCDTVIPIETKLKVDGTMCTWSAFDYSKKESRHRTFLAHFNRETQSSSITDAAVNFKSVFSKGKRFAKKSNIHDPPNLQAAGYDRSSPPG